MHFNETPCYVYMNLNLMRKMMTTITMILGSAKQNLRPSLGCDSVYSIFATEPQHQRAFMQ